MSLLPSQEQHKKIVGILVPLFLIIALPVLLLSARQTTEYKQHASGVQDINSGFTITQTNNPDGTMGPGSWKDNFSNSLPLAQQGTLTLLMANTPQGSSTNMPSQTDQGHTLSVVSLSVTVTKAEVHLSQTFDKKRADQWETLSIESPQTIDFGQLSQGNFSLLGLTNLAAGMYPEIRLYLANPSVVLSDGTKAALTMPGKNKIVRITQPFTVSPGDNTNLTIVFDIQHSVITQENAFILKPVVSAMIESHGVATPTIQLPAQK